MPEQSSLSRRGVSRERPKLWIYRHGNALVRAIDKLGHRLLFRNLRANCRRAARISIIILSEIKTKEVAEAPFDTDWQTKCFGHRSGGLQCSQKGRGINGRHIRMGQITDEIACKRFSLHLALIAQRWVHQIVVRQPVPDDEDAPLPGRDLALSFPEMLRLLPTVYIHEFPAEIRESVFLTIRRINPLLLFIILQWLIKHVLSFHSLSRIRMRRNTGCF
mmetsp:Transcript_119558/g.255110  ORF Transcript_119558/g.255110 Transcript_119558/m.255110 type:complete len:219 (+) Transcript_119558:483-1139(+)